MINEKRTQPQRHETPGSREQVVKQHDYSVFSVTSVAKMP